MSEETIRAALRGATPPEGDELAWDVYGLMLKLTDSFTREQARERGLLAIANFCQNFAGADGALSREDVARVETRIVQALAEGPAKPDDEKRMRAPEKVIEAIAIENRLIRERLRISQVIVEAISRATAALPAQFFTDALAGVTAEALQVIVGANRLVLEEDSCRTLLESIDEPRVRLVLDKLLSLNLNTAAPAPAVELDPDGLARVERIEAACLRVFTAASNLAQATNNEQVAYGLSVLSLALTVTMDEVQQVTGDEGRLAADLVVSIGKEVGMLREVLKSAKATIEMLIPGSPALHAARRSTLRMITEVMGKPSALELPTMRLMVARAGHDGRTLGGGICPVHGRVPADHDCAAYRPGATA